MPILWQPFYFPGHESLSASWQPGACSLWGLSIGDSVNDILAAKNAGVVSCAALWECSNAGALRNAGSEHDFSNPGQFKDFVLNGYTDTKTV